MTKHIKRTSINEQAFNQIREMILESKLDIGAKIPSEVSLAEMFNISRISVREAIKQLVGLGILESRQGSGTYVCATHEQVLNPTFADLNIQCKQDLRDLLEVRRAIEVEAAGLASQRATDKQIIHIQDVCEKLSSEGLTHEENTHLDMEFHNSIVRAANNRYISKMMDAITMPLKGFYNTALICRFNECNGQVRHRQISNAIVNRNATEARMIMQFHIDDTIEAIFNSQNQA